MDRRTLMRSTVALGVAPLLPTAVAQAATPFRRVRPTDAAWPSDQRWAALNTAVGGRLERVRSLLAECLVDPHGLACDALFKAIKNPYYNGDNVGLTQTLGWAGAWTSSPSVYAVAAESTADVVAAVNFAREHRLRLVVKGGGHSYQGTSNAPDSLLIWTRKMHDATLHDAFVPQGCEGRMAPQPAVTLGAGAMWMQAYNAVTTQGGRYVQGGGCTTVGVAGLIQSGGFGSFSKNFGTAAGNLLEAEVVTADGQVRIANACSNPDLFWGLKGGGGGSLGVVTRLTVRTHDLPAFFGAANADITATSDAAYRRLVAEFVRFYAGALFNPHWGEQAHLTPENILRLRMVFQGLTQGQAQATWRPFFEWVKARPADYTLANEVVIAVPAHKFWDATFMKALPGAVVGDDRPGASADTFFWKGDQGQSGWFIHCYQSAWLPAALLAEAEQGRLADALFAASRAKDFGLHFNKGLAGGSAGAVADAGDTAMNPAVFRAFALAIAADGENHAYPGVAGHEPHLDDARNQAVATQQAMDALRAVAPHAGAYLSESNYFEPDYRSAYWGTNYERLARVKAKYDPEGLFFVHQGVGSDLWSADGFTRKA